MQTVKCENFAISKLFMIVVMSAMALTRFAFALIVAIAVVSATATIATAVQIGDNFYVFGEYFV